VSADIEDLVRRIVDQTLTRQAHPRIAMVTSYDPNRHSIKAKQMPEGHETGWMPIGTMYVGNGFGVVAGMNAGDQVIVGYHEGDIESPFVLGRVHSDQERPPVAQSGEIVIQTSNSMIKIDQAGNLTQNASGSVSTSAGGSLSMSGATSVSLDTQGATSLTGNGQFTYNGQSVYFGTTLPSLSGDVSGTFSSTSIGSNKVTNAKLAQAAALTLKGNNTALTANVGDLTVAQVVALLNVLSASATGQQITGGARITPFLIGTVTTGTLTPDPGNGPMQYVTVNGPIALAPGANRGQYTLEITNGASVGTAPTTAGFSTVKGDAFTTVSGSVFTCSVIIGQNKSTLIVVAN
jgi:hypothetical protein